MSLAAKLSIRRTSGITEILQSLCEDILKNGVTLPDQRICWCKLVTQITDNPRYNFPHYGNIVISELVRRGVLMKALVGTKSALANSLPKKFFSRGKGNPPKQLCSIYIVQDKNELRLLTQKEGAQSWLGEESHPKNKPIAFQEALQRVKDEIYSHPDPPYFFSQVVRKLCP